MRISAFCSDASKPEDYATGNQIIYISGIDDVLLNENCPLPTANIIKMSNLAWAKEHRLSHWESNDLDFQNWRLANIMKMSIL